VIEPKCVHCHGHFGDYATVLKNLDQIKKHALILRDMPKQPETPLTADQYALLNAWVSAGGPETAPEPVLPTFASLSATVFQPICVNCHKNGSEAPVHSANGTNVFFESEEQLIAAGEIVPGYPDASKLYQRVTLPTTTDGHMPDSGPMLPGNVLTAIHDWIQSMPPAPEPSPSPSPSPSP
jgi:hypothetical protein